MTGTQDKTSETSPDTVAFEGQVPRRPCTLASAQAERRSIDDEGTLYAPTSVSLDAGAFIEDTCPMHFTVTDEGTYIELGDTNTTLNLAFSDKALINIARLALQAVRALVRTREDADLSSLALKIE